MADRPSFDDIVRDVGRELGMRRTMYPKWVAARRMTKAEADQRTACMDSLYRFCKENRDALLAMYERPSTDALPTAPTE